MGDFPGTRVSGCDIAPSGILSTAGPESMIGSYLMIGVTAASSGAVWPAANLAIYQPVVITEAVTAYQMAVEVTTQAGNLDLGIYDEGLNRLVSLGSTAVGAAGLQVGNITDTPLAPGLYYIAMNCSSATAAFRRHAPGVQVLRCSGAAQQAVGAVTLPNPATFAAAANAYVPIVFIALTATTL
jgi:hypothetical protein